MTPIEDETMLSPAVTQGAKQLSPLRAAVPTSRALQRIVKSPADGDFGPNSIRALQRYLNRGVLAGKFKLP